MIPKRREQIPSLPASLQMFLAWRKAATVFAGMAALVPWEASVTGDGEPERLGGARVSSNFFTVLGVPIVLGRDFSNDDERPGNERVVIISDGLWQQRYGGDPAVVGRTMMLNGESHRIAGVAPASLLVPTRTEMHALLPFAPRVDVWKPIVAAPGRINNESWDHGVFVRLKDRAKIEDGRQQLAAILTELGRAQMPNLDTKVEIQLLPAREIYAGRVRLRLLLVLAASALLLLAACASIANVFLASVASRANEFATRVALGASRGRILSQTLTEAVLLSLAGGVLGALVAKYGTRRGRGQRARRIAPARGFERPRTATRRRIRCQPRHGRRVRHRPGVERVASRPGCYAARRRAHDARRTARRPHASSCWSAWRWRWRRCCWHPRGC